MFKISATVEGTVSEVTTEAIASGERAVSRGVGAAGKLVKDGWRGQVLGANLGRKLGNTIRLKTYPSGPSLDSAAYVYTKAPEIISAFAEGVTIRSKSGFWLAIPTEQLRKSRGARGRRWTPAEWERRYNRRLHFVYGRGKKNGDYRTAMLMDIGGAPIKDRVMGRGGVHRAARKVRKRAVPVFWLVPQARLQKRLSLDRDVAAARGALPGLIRANWREGKRRT